MASITFGILTVSDRCFQGTYEDVSGKMLKDEISNTFPNGKIKCKAIVKDDSEMIRKILLEWVEKKCNVVFTTGGTGFSQRDVTPEATKSVIEREAPGLSHAMLGKSLKVTEKAMLSRLVCGIKDETIIINLPGSANAALECFRFVKNSIPHAVDLLLGRISAIERAHGQPHSSQKSKVKIDPINRDRISRYPMVEVEEALKSIFVETYPTSEVETVYFEDSLHRVLAENVVCTEPIPPYRASRMDGYAVLNDGYNTKDVELVSAAGDCPGKTELVKYKAVRVSTGAPVPENAYAVVRVEDTELLKKIENGEQIKIRVMPKENENIREIGSDAAKDSIILNRTDVLTPFHLGLLASLGHTSVKVFKRKSIGVISTGNEIRAPSDQLQPGQVRDSNKITIMSLLKKYSYKSADCGIVKDNPDSIKMSLENAFHHHDVVITSGGVSMGEFDVIKQVLVQDFGAYIHFGQVNMKPGKPTVFATLTVNEKLKIFFGLPGNPVSTSVTCLIFVIPCLRFMERRKDYMFPKVSIWKQPIAWNGDRPEYLRVSVALDGNGDLIANQVTENQMSSRLCSMIGANGLLIVNSKFEGSAVGQDVEYKAIIFDVIS